MVSVLSLNVFIILLNVVFFLLKINEALVAQSVERQAVNLQVDCSNQSWGEFFFLKNIGIHFALLLLNNSNFFLIFTENYITY